MKDNLDLEKGGVKYDVGKVRMDLIPQDALMGIAAVLTYGAKKYDDWNWAKGMRAGRLHAAIARHQAAMLLGEELDEESGLPHSWHLGCCVLMLISAKHRGVLVNDVKLADQALAEVRILIAGMKEPPALPAALQD